MCDSSLSRRHFLAGGLAAGVAASAGCLGSGDSVLGEDTGSELTISLSRVDGPLRDKYVRESADPADHWDEQALKAALNDERDTTQLRQPFFARPDDPAYVVHEGTYYQLGSVIVDEVAETHPVLRLFEADDSAANPVDGSEDGDLPESDHRAVHIAHMAARARGSEGGYPSGLVQRGGYVYRNETAREGSDLLAEDGPTHVTYREATYEVEITRERFHEPIYRPTAEPVTDDPDRMEAILRAALVGARVREDDLSSDARRILTDADTDSYSETHPFSDAYEELLRAIDKRPYIDGNIRKDAGVGDGKELIQYGDTYYREYLRLDDGSD
jgi:hypothetical protein